MPRRERQAAQRRMITRRVAIGDEWDGFLFVSSALAYSSRVLSNNEYAAVAKR